MIILDASVLIAHRDPDDVHHERATQLLIDHLDQGLGASVITVAECLIGPIRAGQQERFQTFLEQLDVSILPVGQSDGRRLATLRARSGLKLPDCCVIAAAQEADGQVATFDEQLQTSSEELGIPVIGAS